MMSGGTMFPIACFLAALLASTAPMPALGGTPLTATPGGQPKLSTAQRETVLRGDFQLHRRVAGIPAAVREAFAGPSFEMADPGESYRVTDTARRGLPARRLVFAGCSTERCVLHYEKGGLGHGYFVVVFDLSPNGTALFYWGATVSNAAADIADLRSKINTGEFDDGHLFNW